MSQPSLITPEIEALIGKEKVFPNWEEMSRATLRRFAISIESQNPVYYDEEKAKKTRFKGLIAPPTMIFEMNHNWADKSGELVTSVTELRKLLPPFQGTIRGGNEYEFYQPVRPGDLLTTRQKIKKIYEQPGKSGTMLFVISELTCYNQRNEKLGLNRETIIIRFPNAGGGAS